MRFFCFVIRLVGEREFNMVSEKRILDLQKIISEEYGQKLSFKETTEVANTLVEWFDLLAQIYHKTKNPEE